MNVNKQNIKNRFMLWLFLCGILTACAPKDNQSPTKSAIKARQDLMHDWRDARGIIKNMLKNPHTFQAKTLQEQADFINQSKGEMWRYFDDKTPNNRVNELIQNDPEGFWQAARDFDVLIEQFNQKAKTAQAPDEIADDFKRLNASCKSCHDVYKKL